MRELGGAHDDRAGGRGTSRLCAQSHDLSLNQESAAELTEHQAPWKHFIAGGVLRQQGVGRPPGSSVCGREEEGSRVHGGLSFLPSAPP